MHCTDPDGGAVVYALASGSTHGAQVSAITGAGTFTYTPPAAFVGGDAITFRASDGTNLSAPATATIVVADHIAPAMALSFVSTHAGSGTVRIRVRCTGDDPCKGSLRLRAGAGGPVFGKGTFSAGIGRTVTVKVKISGSAKTRLRHATIKTIVTATAKDAYGNSASPTAKATLRR